MPSLLFAKACQALVSLAVALPVSSCVISGSGGGNPKGPKNRREKSELCPKFPPLRAASLVSSLRPLSAMPWQWLPLPSPAKRMNLSININK